MCWSSAFDQFEGSTLSSEPVPGGRTDRSREPSRARAVRRLGVPVGMGGKANCLCLRGIWETPKPRYREETKPVVKLPGTTFRAKDPACHARSWGARYRGTETAGPSAERGDSLAPRGMSEFREVSRPRGACSITLAVCAKCPSVLEQTGTRSPRRCSGHGWTDVIDVWTMHPDCLAAGGAAAGRARRGGRREYRRKNSG